ncbi:MAG: hypothetical protein EOM34_17540 [Clostridia bacterium]|nr:hypothetical protein [Lachnospiraceae bacterium]NCC02411.1 hypothetical protein [Clostridia bacterium]NCD04464.1 hypothetical protein [Clostridia bacterium]
MEILKNTKAITTYDIALTGLMVAVIEVSKMLMAMLPNIELTSFWIIMFTIFFGWKIVFVVPVFILIEGCVYGFGMWWVMYLYAWPLLAAIVWTIRKQDSVWVYSIISGVFGLCFGLLCSLPYFVVGFVGGGLRSGLLLAFNWWIAGIPFDIIHCVANFLLMFVLYKPIRSLMMKAKNMGYFS